jgi:hypothetical protein
MRGGIYTESQYVDVPIKISKESGKLDLCDPHYDQLLVPVLEAVADRKEDNLNIHRTHRRKDGPFLCPIPGCPNPVLKHIDSFKVHVSGETKGVHQMPWDEYLATYGEPRPATREELAQVSVEITCPIDGCGKVYSTENGNRWPLGALNSHLRGRHGLKPDGVTPVR